MAYGPVNVSTDNELTKEEILNKINVLDIAHGGTGKITADEAFGNLGKNFGFPNAKNVGDNTDLNTLTKSGFYFSAGSKNTTNTTNIPQLVYDNINSYYELNILVFGLANRVTQIAVYPYNNSTTLYERMWVRTGTGTSVDSLSWSDWKEIFNSKRYIPIANGGTGAGTADTARKYLNAQRRIAQYVSGDGADLDTDVFDFIITTLTNTKHKALRDLGFGNFAYVWQYFYSGASNTTNRVQFAKGYITDKIATRYYNSSTSKWSDWTPLLSANDTSLLATTIQNLLKGGSISVVKSVQRGTMKLSNSPLTISTYESGDGSDYIKYFYYDIKINTVNVSKTFVMLDQYSSKGYKFGIRLLDKNTIRIYMDSDNSETSMTTYYLYRASWQVVEYY